ncbi:alcohol oxidase [Diplocarpon rosae]|nr:alcohol oxidase [Diplocarpon rosae]
MAADDESGDLRICCLKDVIVGGGTAGLTLASRLAENQSLAIAVIEAGGFYEQENGNQTLVPGYYTPNIAGPLTNWNFSTQPQPQLNNDSVTYARGKTLGGSSALNAMLYQRGTQGSYQAWADAVGDDSYTFQNFLPFFQRSVNYTAPNTSTRVANASVPLPVNGTFTSGGPLQVSFPNTATPFSSWGQQGLREIGIPDIADFSSGSLLGSQYCPLTVRPDDQTRSSSESSFLQAAFERQATYPNLAVYIHSLGEKIIFDGDKTATGVQVTSNGLSFLLSASREVIVAAGAFQSPQLLMVSGVGPREELEKHNISCVADRPGVGQNMWDHVLFPVTYEINIATTSVLTDPFQAALASRQYNVNRTGMLTSNSADYLGWEKIPARYRDNLTAAAQADLATFAADWPDLEHVVLGFNPNALVPVDVSYGTLCPALITPLSRGSISLASARMEDAPLINVGWLTSPTDLETAVVGIKRAREFWATSALAGVRVGAEVLPGQDVQTDAQIAAWARGHVQTVYHASCTCKMGRVEDPMAVTDHRARVMGVRGLRVVDANRDKVYSGIGFDAK